MSGYVRICNLRTMSSIMINMEMMYHSLQISSFSVYTIYTHCSRPKSIFVIVLVCVHNMHTEYIHIMYMHICYFVRVVKSGHLYSCIKPAISFPYFPMFPHLCNTCTSATPFLHVSSLSFLLAGMVSFFD